jgi:crotonobetainyl-CoA:carnitine CoA-transferase CaiB-like acyl-CoA transferase
MAGPLAGVKVLDFTFYLPGPFCVFILTDLGADTIKVERVTPKASGGPPDKSETIRKAYDPRDRNKRSIALDLKSKEGKEIYLKLAIRGPSGLTILLSQESCMAGRYFSNIFSAFFQ